jgi:hypothetical protein
MLAVVASCAGSPTQNSQASPKISNLAPSRGPVGTTVTVVGSSFAAEGNVVRFGQGYIRDLKSSDGSTLTFVVPAGLDLCAPNSTGPCQGALPRVRPGEYEIVVLAVDGASNSIPFTVTDR